MKLGDKITDLRKQYGWSQEELAEKMNVSRQSVSKWESAMSIPDLNKIIKLAEIFSVSTDYLLKDDIEKVDATGDDYEENVIKVSLEEVNTYLDSKDKVNSITARGVLMFITSVMPMFLLLGLASNPSMNFSENTAIASGLAILLIMIAIGVAIVIGAEKHKKNFDVFEERDFELMYGVESIIKERAEAFSGTYTTRLSICVAMFILGPLTILFGGIFEVPQSMILYLMALLLTIIGMAVFLLIPVTGHKEGFDRVLKAGGYGSVSKQRETKRAEKLGAFYWPLVVAIYLAWSFITFNWGFTWIVWPIAAVTFPALIGLMGLFDKE